MRFLHTADWHLGRMFAGCGLLESQQYSLRSLAAIAAELCPDAILIAGDLYDRAVPPEDAVQVFDEILIQLAGIAPVLAIAGNHDSAGRIDFGRRLLRQAGVHIVGSSRDGIERVDLADAHGPVSFHLMPFASPEVVRCDLHREDLRSHDAATRARIEAIAPAPISGRHVLVGHLFAQGGDETKESERDISVGGVSTVDPSIFAPFCYTALGHLHRPHFIGLGRVRYSGSLGRYSFSEESHRKTVSLVTLDAVGGVHVEEIDLPQQYGMRTLRGRFLDLLSSAANDQRRTLDLVRVVLTDPLPLPGAHEQLRQLYPLLRGFAYEPPPSVAVGGPASVLPEFKQHNEHSYIRHFLAERYPDSGTASISDLAHICMEKALQQQERI